VIYVTNDQMEAMTMGTRIAVLKDGLLQQLDTPQHLYDHPTNMFVAGFIGSPAMNFFDGKIASSNGDIFVEGSGFRLKTPAEKSAKLKQAPSSEIVLGVRPEDILDRAFVPDAPPEYCATVGVDVVEPMGSEIFVYLTIADQSFVARMDPRSQARAGQRIEVVFGMDKMHAFDRRTEQALTS
jgi:multiple sugar transport system ATP-binding protein